eukprot:TRINITY_DN7945_c0_g1_i2.p1 TRINITY_DN7945_c0_g1~~TRINITY_DN7945_c0_g1_i2.p1  ORF type:complete len:175 (-),score=31.47 TRINITY_DN7945_c0_g1_i2:155-679(-)
MIFECKEEVFDDCYVQSTVNSETTHLVLGKQQRTEKVLLAISRGIWVLTADWIRKSHKNRKWAKESDYEAMKWFPGCIKSREARETSDFLFKNMKFNLGTKTQFPGDKLESIITNLGGEMTDLIEDADYCVSGFRHLSKLNELDRPPKLITEKWIFDSLSEWKIPSNYEDYLPE